jgi:hypothetical protein
MPLIAYQSFNANSASEHDLSSAAMQTFTIDTNKYVTGQGQQALVLPYIPGNLTLPVQGPAQLLPINPLGPKPEKESRKRKHDDSGDDDTPPAKVTKIGDHSALVLGSQISLAWQNFYREFGEMPAIMVCGELDASHSDFKKLVDDENISTTPIPSKKAAQSFTAYTSNGIAAVKLGAGDGFVAYSIGTLNIVFVHVPNAIAKKEDKTISFYKNIAQSLLTGGKIIHLVIGDTNQGRADFTADALNSAFQTKAYRSALAGRNIRKIDNYGVTERGTNSTGTSLYDVAVYRSDIVEIKKDVAYLSQSSSGTTVTDHCGLGIAIDLKGAT